MNIDNTINNILSNLLDKWEKENGDTYKTLFVQFDFGSANIAHLWSFDEYKLDGITNSSASRLHSFRPKAPKYLCMPIEANIECYEELEVSLFYQIHLRDRAILKYDKYTRSK